MLRFLLATCGTRFRESESVGLRGQCFHSSRYEWPPRQEWRVSRMRGTFHSCAHGCESGTCPLFYPLTVYLLSVSRQCLTHSEEYARHNLLIVVAVPLAVLTVIITCEFTMVNDPAVWAFPCVIFHRFYLSLFVEQKSVSLFDPNLVSGEP